MIKRANELVYNDIGQWITFKVPGEIAYITGLLNHYTVVSKTSRKEKDVVAVQVNGVKAPYERDFFVGGPDSKTHFDLDPSTSVMIDFDKPSWLDRL